MYKLVREAFIKVTLEKEGYLGYGRRMSPRRMHKPPVYSLCHFQSY